MALTVLPRAPWDEPFPVDAFSTAACAAGAGLGVFDSWRRFAACATSFFAPSYTAPGTSPTLADT